MKKRGKTEEYCCGPFSSLIPSVRRFLCRTDNRGRHRVGSAVAKKKKVRHSLSERLTLTVPNLCQLKLVFGGSSWVLVGYTKNANSLGYLEKAYKIK
ncbi:MAG: hypothetical protein AMJ91_06585 [candidate division Zixibacteria bacterium SM23_73_3]|nr:MAG: hypothetical protein AMJ91_06585 [candidate division Zixibacteria bacterium SM23_73_3]